MCGEKNAAALLPLPVLGSPPHVRGKAISSNSRTENAGITPACAGKRTRRRCCRFRFWDHPRMCGEKLLVATPGQKMPGSPPHVRGKAYSSAGHWIRRGITPACAGKRDAEFFRLSISRDHPRMCGEKALEQRYCRLFGGSPPHVRGKGYAAGFAMYFEGITPACAGKRVLSK